MDKVRCFMLLSTIILSENQGESKSLQNDIIKGQYALATENVGLTNDNPISNENQDSKSEEEIVLGDVENNHLESEPPSSKDMPNVDFDTKSPREVVITSLERSDFEHLSEKQFQHIKEMELLLKEHPSEKELHDVDINRNRQINLDEDFHTVALPKDFTQYDINKDKKITLEELIETTGAMENVDLAFAASDIDDDGYLDKEEFGNAPWLLDTGMDDMVDLPSDYKIMTGKINKELPYY